MSEEKKIDLKDRMLSDDAASQVAGGGGTGEASGTYFLCQWCWQRFHRYGYYTNTLKYSCDLCGKENYTIVEYYVDVDKPQC